MKRLIHSFSTILILTAFCLSVSHAADVTRNSDNNRVPLPGAYKFGIEPIPDLTQVSEGQSEIVKAANAVPSTVSRDITITTALVDSSVNGYGMILPMTNPIYWHPDNGFVLGYRQWLGPSTEGYSSGYIGSAYSSDGEDWSVYSNLNVNLPWGDPPTGRYPSAVGGLEYPYVIWNEYTTAGGGDYGGRPIYSWDQFFYGGGSFFLPPVDINNGCGTLPCDPADNWVGSPSISDDNGTPVLNTTFSGWSGSNSDAFASVRYLYHSSFHASGYFIFNDAYTVFSGDEFEQESASGSYTSSAIVDVNDEGVGYAGVISYFRGSIDDPPTSIDDAHTIMLRKTEDYGGTWSSDGQNGSDYYYISTDAFKSMFIDSGLMEPFMADTTGDGNEVLVTPSDAYVPYDFDMKVDADGGVHIVAGVIPSEGGFIYWVPGCAIYHMYNPDPSNPDTWEAHYIADIYETFMWDVGGTAMYFQVFPELALSVESSDVMYATWDAVTFSSIDTLPDGTIEYNDWNRDVFIARSEDSGRTWPDVDNITNTIGQDENNYSFDEIHPHLAGNATDDECYILYNEVEYDVPQEGLACPTTPEDCMQRYWFAKVNYSGMDAGDSETTTIPGAFSLQQNYPNPFNPETFIKFDLNISSEIELVIFDVLGQEIESLVNGEVEAGSHEIVLDASGFSAGVYFYRLTVDDISDTKKMILLK